MANRLTKNGIQARLSILNQLLDGATDDEVKHYYLIDLRRQSKLDTSKFNNTWALLKAAGCVESRRHRRNRTEVWINAKGRAFVNQHSGCEQSEQPPPVLGEDTGEVEVIIADESISDKQHFERQAQDASYTPTAREMVEILHVLRDDNDTGFTERSQTYVKRRIEFKGFKFIAAINYMRGLRLISVSHTLVGQEYYKVGSQSTDFYEDHRHLLEAAPQSPAVNAPVEPSQLPRSARSAAQNGRSQMSSSASRKLPPFDSVEGAVLRWAGICGGAGRFETYIRALGDLYGYTEDQIREALDNLCSSNNVNKAALLKPFMLPGYSEPWAWRLV